MNRTTGASRLDFMSAPHTYVNDRPVLRHLRWWVNSGENFEPENTVPVPASGFVRRLAHTPHYDGGEGPQRAHRHLHLRPGPVEFKLVDPSKPPVREL